MDIKPLIAVLKEEISVYEKLLDLCRQETQVLITGKVGRLDEIVKQQSAFITSLGRLEAQREQMIEDMAAAMGIDVSNITMSMIIERVSEADAPELRDIQRHLNDILKEHKRINDLNCQLIKNSLDFIDYTLGLLLDLSSDAGYTAEGVVQRMEADATILDRRA